MDRVTSLWITEKQRTPLKGIKSYTQTLSNEQRMAQYQSYEGLGCWRICRSGPPASLGIEIRELRVQEL